MRNSPIVRSAVVAGSLLVVLGMAPSVDAANLLAGPKMPPQREGVKKQSKKPAIKKDMGLERTYQQWDTSIADWVAGMERPMSVPEVRGLDRLDVEIGR
jgi:hypothetical protein